MIQLPHLETNVTSACQLRCLHCNHFIALDAVATPKPFMLDPAQLERDVRVFARLAHTRKYGMLGGEPTLHPGLPDLVKVVRDSGITNEIEVWSNGIRVLDLPDAFWQAPWDALVLSRYPNKLNDSEVVEIAARCDRAGKRFECKDESRYPNFTQLLKKVPGRAQETYDRCWFRTFSRVLDNGFLYQCCCGPYVPRLLLGLPEGTDGLAITEATTEQDVIDYLWQREALQSCAPCAGRNTADAVPVQWGEERNPVKWLERSSGRA